MAILNRIALIPSAEECSLLTQIKGTFELWEPELVAGASPQNLTLCGVASDLGICISSDYRDVRFKFECLYMKVSQQSPNGNVSKGRKLVLSTWQRAKVVLRAEWERLAANSEVPTNYDQIIQVRGEISKVPFGVSACISMVGILFYGESDLVVGLVYLDDEFPLSITYVEDPQVIEAFISESTVIPVDEIGKLRQELSDWNMCS